MKNNVCGIKELSNYLDISVSEVRKLTRAKMIPHFRLGNRIKYRLTEIEKWIKQLEETEGKNPLFF